MRYYLHWLDGGFLNMSRLLDMNMSMLDVEADRALKAFALFGVQIVLSDVQITESKPILRLFRDDNLERNYPGFSEFLEEDPDFLHLVADPGGVEQSTESFAIATSGYRRAQREGWMSGFYPNPYPFVRLGEHVLAAGEIDADRLISGRRSQVASLLERYPGDAPWLAASLRAVEHFAYNPARVSRPRNELVTLYQVLLQSQNDRELRSDALMSDRVGLTIEFIQQNVDPSDSGRMATIVRALQARLDKAAYMPIWTTAFSAWLRAVQNTVGPAGGSIGYLPGYPDLGLYLDDPVEILVPSPWEGTEVSLPRPWHRVPEFLKVDPLTLRWDQITKAVHATKATGTRDAFRRALLSNDDESALIAAAEHARQLANVLEPMPGAPLPMASWALMTAASLGGASLAHSPLPAAVTQAGLGIYGGVRNSLAAIKRRVIVNTLTRTGAQISRNIRPE